MSLIGLSGAYQEPLRSLSGASQVLLRCLSEAYQIRREIRYLFRSDLTDEQKMRTFSFFR